jgi:hypothetical protein
MKFRLLVALSIFFVNSASAQDIGIPCRGSPDAAVLSVPGPADLFVHVICTRFGHIIHPVQGWLWTTPGAVRPHFFPAQMVRAAPKPVGNEIYFQSIEVNKLDQETTSEKWSIFEGMFDEDDRPLTKALEIVATNDTGGTHTIYIFPNKFGYSCSPTCKEENIFVMISETEKNVEW